MGVRSQAAPDHRPLYITVALYSFVLIIVMNKPAVKLEGGGRGVLQRWSGERLKLTTPSLL